MIKPRQAAASSIEKIINKKTYSNDESAYWLKKTNWSGEDQRLYLRLVYGTLENLFLIDRIIEVISGRKISKIDSMAIGILRISAYQLIYLDRIPAYAIINEAVDLTKLQRPKAAGFVNAVLRNILREYQKYGNETAFLEQYTNGEITLQYSHAKWIINKFLRDYSNEDTITILKYHQEPPALTIRLNPLKGDMESIINHMKSDGICVKHISWMPESYVVESTDQLITTTTSYKNGLFQIQSIASMLAVHWLDPQPNELVVDVAAAPGGKTTHICQRMKNQGKIIARDISSSRLQQIMQHTNRLGCEIVDTQVKDGVEFDQPLAYGADRVLVDVPCSSMGMIRKKPELKLIYKQDDFSYLPSLQESLLENSSTMVKTGGVLVYSTCTYFSEENSSVVLSFLERHPEFQLDRLNIDDHQLELDKGALNNGMIQLGPHIHPLLDGFFVAKFVRKHY